MAGFIWRSKESGNLVMPTPAKMFLVTSKCPCCEMKVIGKEILISKYADTTNHSDRCVEGRSDHPYRWNLKEFWGNGIGIPFGMWVIRDVGSSRWKNPTNGCSGITYGFGPIDCNGKLWGLPQWFQTGYSYDGHMQLLQACLKDDGNFYTSCGRGQNLTDSYSPFTQKNNGNYSAYLKKQIPDSDTKSTGFFNGEKNV